MVHAQPSPLSGASAPSGSASSGASEAGRDARRAAFETLRRVVRQGETLDAAMAAAPRWSALAARDKAFARHLVATTLRRLGQIDDALAGCLDKPLKAKLNAVHDLLRLGAAQVLFMEVADHAAVGETVGLAAGVRVGPHKGLLNAVLRRLTREKDAILARQAEAPGGLAALNTPGWLYRRWCAAYGAETAAAIAAQHLREPPLDLRAKADPADPADPATWAERLGARHLPLDTLRLDAGSGEVRRLPGYDAGTWWVQDAAAGLPARLLGDVAGREVVDLCAAPGGKTAYLAAAGARVVAVDRAAERLKALSANLARLSLSATTVVAEVQDWTPPAPPDLILLDAPCTATGTLRRHPDIAHLKRESDVAAMADLQAELLHAAAAMLAPGGTLVYAVCSLEPEEGPNQVDRLLHGAPDLAPDLARVPVTAAEVPGFEDAVTPAGDLRTLPCHWADLGGMDGFYAARLRKAA